MKTTTLVAAISVTFEGAQRLFPRSFIWMIQRVFQDCMKPVSWLFLEHVEFMF